VSDVGSDGGKTFSGVINGNPAALIDVQNRRFGRGSVGARASRACARLDESDFKNYGKGHIP